MNTQQVAVDEVVAELAQVKAALATTSTDVATVSAGITTLETQALDLQAQIAALQAAQAAGTPVDLTALVAASDQLVTVASDVKSNADAVVAKLPGTVPVP